MTATNEGEREARRLADSASEEATKLADTARDEAAKLADTAKGVGRDQAEKQLERTKGVVGEQIGTVEAALDGAANRLRDENSPLASYASDLSSRLSGLSSRIEGASVDDLARDARTLARDNPAMFMLGAVAVGFVASRFLKASDQADRDYVSDRFGDDGYARGAGGGDYRMYGRDDAYRGGAYASDPYAASGAYRSPVADPVAPRDAADPAPRAPMDSSASATAGTAGAGTDPVRPRVNLPVNDLPKGAPGAAGTTNEGDK